MDGFLDFLLRGNCSILGCFSTFFLAGHRYLALRFIRLNFRLTFFCNFFNYARLIIFILLNLLKCHRFELFLLLAAEPSLLGEC